MNWLLKFLTSSIGRKLLMSLTGLFLCLYLVIHVAGNLQLFISDNGEAFNTYAHFMTSNPLIKVVAWLTKITIVLHAAIGIYLWSKNKAAKGTTYKAKTGKSSSWSSRNMAFLGTVLLAFIVIHLNDFWYKSFIGALPMIDYGHGEIKDLYSIVGSTFKTTWIVVLYVVSMFSVSFHLVHGFQSGFQSLGLNHKKYMPFIQTLSIWVFAIIIPLLFAAMPVYFYFK